MKRAGFAYKYDVTVPHDKYVQILTEVKTQFSHLSSCIAGFGHFAEGGLHVNLVTFRTHPSFSKLIESFLFRRVKEVGGSISSEVGIGVQRRDSLHYSKPINAINLMKKMKTILDRKSILNPYKLLPSNLDGQELLSKL